MVFHTHWQHPFPKISYSFLHSHTCSGRGPYSCSTWRHPFSLPSGWQKSPHFAIPSCMVHHITYLSPITQLVNHTTGIHTLFPSSQNFGPFHVSAWSSNIVHIVLFIEATKSEHHMTLTVLNGHHSGTSARSTEPISVPALHCLQKSMSCWFHRFITIERQYQDYKLRNIHFHETSHPLHQAREVHLQSKKRKCFSTLRLSLRRDAVLGKES